jgi:hypothetical protein
MAVNLSPVFGVAGQLFDNNGNPLAGGKIYTYLAGTTTNAATYTSSTGNIAHSNPIVLDGAGRVPSGEIWLTDGISYKFVVEDAASNLIGTYDNLIGINSNFVNFTNSQEIQAATANQTVFNLATMQYQPGTNSLTVFVDGVNQYGPGAQYAYVETDSDTVTFINGLHVGALVKFTTSQLNTSGGVDAQQVSYNPPFVGGDATNVEAKLAQTVSVEDFGAIGNGIADDTAAIQNAIDSGAKKVIGIAGKNYRITNTLTIDTDKLTLDFQQAELLLDDSTGLLDHIFLGNGTTQRGGINLYNIIFTRQQVATAGYAINSDFIGVCEIAHCRVFGNNEIHGGFRIYRGIMITIQNNYIDNCVNFGVYLQGSGLGADRTVDVNIRENRIEGGVSALVSWDFTEGLYVRDNIFFNTSSTGVALNASSNANGLLAFKLQENDFDTIGATGLYINNISNIQVTDNWYSNNTGTDLLIDQNVEAIVVDANQFYPNQNGIEIRGDDVQVTGNLISGGTTCIALSAPTQRVNISSNILSNAQFGINISTADNVLVTGNQIYGMSLGTITGETTGTNIFIYSNKDGVIGSGFIGSVGPSPYTYTAGSRTEVLNITTGTISSVTSSGTPLAFSVPCTLVLAPNQSIVITYTVAPSITRTLGF